MRGYFRFGPGLVVGCLFILLTAGLFGQGALSTVRGVVADQSGGLVPGADIVLTDMTTNIAVRTLVSRDDGSFEIPDLRPGSYRMTVSLPGFRTFVADDIRLEAGQIRRIEIAMQLGDIAEQVTVTAGAAVITTDTATLATNIVDVKLKDSPLNNSYPKPWTYMVTLPGVQSEGGNAQVAGQSLNQVSHGFDGVENDRQGNQMNNIYFFEELTVGTVNNRADQSRIANYQLSSKRGNNTFRGSALYRFFDSSLEARLFFDPEKTPFRQHEFQFEVAGPIFKEKTYYYASWFGQRFPLGSYRIADVPNEAFRQGNFSQLSTVVRDPLTGQQFPGNIIPADRINPVSARIQQLYIPAPNLSTTGALTRNLGFAHDYPNDLYTGDWPFVRIDHNISSQNMLYGRYTLRKTPYVLSGGLPGLEWTRTRDHSQFVVSDTHMFTPSLVNTFRFGWALDKVVDGTEVDGRTPINAADAVAAIGLQGVNRQNLSSMGFPTTAITGFTTLSVTNGGIANDDNTYTFDEALTWVKGAHVWKFGGVVRKMDAFNSKVSNDNYGNLLFNGSYSGAAYADFLLGIPNRTIRLDPFIGRTQNQTEIGIYVMDTFKVTRKLTLDYGVRWDYFGSPTYEDGLQFNWDPSTGNVLVAPGTLSRVSPLYPATITVVEGEVVPETDNNNFRPRLGVAYRMREDLVIRGGYGVFTPRIAYFDRALGTGPFEIAETYFNRITGGVPLFTLPNPFPTDLASAAIPSQSVRALPKQTKDGAIHQFNISVEKQIRDIGFRMSYVGSRSRGLNYNLNTNKPAPSLTPFTAARRPFPQFVNTTETREDGESNYDSLQFQVTRKVGAFTFNGHWTWANNMHNWLNTENPYDVTSRWARDNLTRRHRVIIDTMIDLPFGRGKTYLADAPSVVDAILGGWNLQTVSIFSTALYFSPAFSGSDPSNTNTIGGLPDRIADGNLPRGSTSVDKWFDSSAFAVPEKGRFGNSGVNVIAGQGLQIHHLTLSKRFQFNERFRLVCTGAISNLFNTPHFTGMRTNISAAGAGELTSIPGRLFPERSSHRHANMQVRLEF